METKIDRQTNTSFLDLNDIEMCVCVCDHQNLKYKNMKSKSDLPFKYYMRTYMFKKHIN